MSEPVLKVEKLTKIFGQSTVAINGISFEVQPNEVFGLIGPNGSGKTTTQRILSTILQKSSGTIRFGNKEIVSESDKDWVRHNIGYVPQGDCLYRDLTIEENLWFFSQPYNLPTQKRKKNIERLLERLELKDRRKTLVKFLSGGFAKRVSIAAALVHHPKFIFFDEVTMGLDPNSRYHIWEIIRELKKEASVIVTTHYMDEAEELCDQVAILSKGEILAINTPEKIIEEYQVKDMNQVLMKVIKKEE
jgi:ABC-2 type transport system ATP-binding protein